MTWESIIINYINYLKEEKYLAKNSIENYIRDLKKMIMFLKTNYPNLLFINIKFNQLSNYLNFIINQGYSERSQARFISTIKSFCNFLVKKKYINNSPGNLLIGPKISKKLPNILSLKEINLLIESINLDTHEGKRNKLILEILYGCGLRISELIQLKYSNINLNKNYIHLLSKGNNIRIIPINKYCKKLLIYYINNIRILLSPKKKYKNYLFINNRGEAISSIMIFTIIRNIANKVGIYKPINLHTFRHSFATHLLERGANINHIKQLLGHNHIIINNNNYHYNINISTEQFKKCILKYHPRN